HLVKGPAVTVDLLVDVGSVLEHAPGIVVDHVGQQQAACLVEAKLDFEIHKRAAFELPGLLQDEKGVARDAAHFREKLRLVLARKDLLLREDEEWLLPRKR